MNLSYSYANFNFKKKCFRIASTSFASLSSNLRQAQVQLGRSSFYYEADTSQDSIYEDPTQKRQGTNFVWFTFLNDIDVKNLVKLQYDKTYFAYFSKISLNGSNQYVCQLSFDAFF